MHLAIFSPLTVKVIYNSQFQVLVFLRNRDAPNPCNNLVPCYVIIIPKTVKHNIMCFA